MRRFLLLLSVLAGCASHPPHNSDVAPRQPEDEVVKQAFDSSNLAARYVRELNKFPGPTRLYVTGQDPGEFHPYVTECLVRIKRISEASFPVEARGKLDGKVVVKFAVARNGQLEWVAINRSSGYKVLDDAIINAVKLSAPFPPFPKELPDELEQLNVVQTFSYSKD